MNVVELIERKRDGGTLQPSEIAELISAYTAADVPDYQMAAMLMAIYHHGLDGRELAAWTEAMLHSGEVLDLSAIEGPKVDKHSTGGVGDKVSLALVPMVAACGVAVPMISGRGLAHTGGTLDKLESIPGIRVRLDPDEFVDVLARLRMVMGGQSATLVPADRSLYALRDVTGTVPSIPLIASSIMSKKLAEDADALVLDVKVGSGAFMKDETAARALAETMVGIGRAHDTDVVALITDMDQPLGREVGNANELIEAIMTLRGRGPSDLTEVTYRLAEQMLILGGVATEHGKARAKLERAVSSGAALELFARSVEAQGGDPRALKDTSRLPHPPEMTTIRAPRSGYVVRCDALAIGTAAVRLGAGRAKKEDDIDPRVGFSIHAKLGDRIDEGDILARVGWADRARLDDALRVLKAAWEINDHPPAPRPLIWGEVR